MKICEKWIGGRAFSLKTLVANKFDVANKFYAVKEQKLVIIELEVQNDVEQNSMEDTAQLGDEDEDEEQEGTSMYQNWLYLDM